MRQVVSTAGGVLYAASYSAFGQLLSGSGTGGDRFGFTGRELSAASGDYYYRARYYSPGAGRFLGEDPSRFAAGDSKYRYVLNVPTSFSDPSGLLGWSSQGAKGGALGGAVIGAPIGGLVGGVLGAPAGPVAMVAGSGIGALAGALVGGGIGYVSGGVVVGTFYPNATPAQQQSIGATTGWLTVGGLALGVGVFFLL